MYDGHIENGKVVFDEPVSLPDGTPVRVEAVNGAKEVPTPTPDEPAFLEDYKNVIGKDLDLPSDGSINIDHYLYGHPKR